MVNYTTLAAHQEIKDQMKDARLWINIVTKSLVRTAPVLVRGLGTNVNVLLENMEIIVKNVRKHRVLNASMLHNHHYTRSNVQPILLKTRGRRVDNNIASARCRLNLLRK